MNTELQYTTSLASSSDSEFLELSSDLIDDVSGGVLPLLGVLGAVITFAPEIEAAVNGFFEAL